MSYVHLEVQMLFTELHTVPDGAPRDLPTDKFFTGWLEMFNATEALSDFERLSAGMRILGDVTVEILSKEVVWDKSVASRALVLTARAVDMTEEHRATEARGEYQPLAVGDEVELQVCDVGFRTTPDVTSQGKKHLFYCLNRLASRSWYFYEGRPRVLESPRA